MGISTKSYTSRFKSWLHKLFRLIISSTLPRFVKNDPISNITEMKGLVGPTGPAGPYNYNNMTGPQGYGGPQHGMVATCSTSFYGSIGVGSGYHNPGVGPRGPGLGLYGIQSSTNTLVCECCRCPVMTSNPECVVCGMEFDAPYPPKSMLHLTAQAPIRSWTSSLAIEHIRKGASKEQMLHAIGEVFDFELISRVINS